MAKKFSEDILLHKFIVEHLTYKCTCGHSVVIIKDKAICTHCNKWVFKNKEDEFKYRLKENLTKQKYML